MITTMGVNNLQEQLARERQEVPDLMPSLCHQFDRLWRHNHHYHQNHHHLKKILFGIIINQLIFHESISYFRFRDKERIIYYYYYYWWCTSLLSKTQSRPYHPNVCSWQIAIGGEWQESESYPVVCLTNLSITSSMPHHGLSCLIVCLVWAAAVIIFIFIGVADCGSYDKNVKPTADTCRRPI